MVNGTILQYFHWYLPGHGNLWKEIKENAPRLAQLGFTAIWFPPAFKAANGGYSTGYDVYDLYDLGEFDQKGTVPTKYGTREEYLEALKAVRANGMRVIVDIVLNHKAGGDEIERIKVVKVNPDDRNEDISEPFDIDAFTKFTFPGRQKKYSAFEWTHSCFTGVDYAHDLSEDGIFRIVKDSGSSWQEMIDDEKGNYDYLMYNDIDFRNDFVREELNRWGKWYWEQGNFDGVRLDAVKHISPFFYVEWLHALRSSISKEIFAVGEYWAPGQLYLLLRYIEATGGSMSLFDSSLHHNLHHASRVGNKYDMRNIFKETLVKAMPEKAVTVVSNHDTQPLQALEAPVDPWFKPIAYALILLRQEGYPCVFYPDLFGANYRDYGKDGNEYDIWMPGVPKIEKLMQARKDHAYGFQRDYFNHRNCVGWTREGDGYHSGCAVLISNGDNGHKRMEVGKWYAGKTFVDLLENRSEEITIGKNGWAEFFAPAGSVSVWVAKWY
ncbi:MAG: alpha-amylase [Ginsengibacter sp.]